TPLVAGQERDEKLAGLLDQLSEKQRRGEFVDVEGLARQHPDLAGELRQLWAAVQVAGAFGRPSLPTRTPRPDPPSGVLPRRFGDYELLEELGRGGMGVVYRARQISLDRIVALKMLRGTDQASQEELQRFRVEAETAARLDHPNIVPVHDVGEID